MINSEPAVEIQQKIGYDTNKREIDPIMVPLKYLLRYGNPQNSNPPVLTILRASLAL